MKKFTWLLCMAVCYSTIATAQDADYKVVFDLTSRDTANQQAIIRELGLIRASNPRALLEVVIYGQGLDLVVQGRTVQETALRKLLTDKDISFKVCAMTLKRNNIDKSQLIPGVEVVPDGIYEIITKQKQGWGYIKVAH